MSILHPRIPRHRAPVIRCGGHWYESAAARVLVIVCITVFAGVLTHSLIA